MTRTTSGRRKMLRHNFNDFTIYKPLLTGSAAGDARRADRVAGKRLLSSTSQRHCQLKNRNVSMLAPVLLSVLKKAGHLKSAFSKISECCLPDRLRCCGRKVTPLIPPRAFCQNLPAASSPQVPITPWSGHTPSTSLILSVSCPKCSQYWLYNSHNRSNELGLQWLFTVNPDMNMQY